MDVYRCQLSLYKTQPSSSPLFTSSTLSAAHLLRGANTSNALPRMAEPSQVHAVAFTHLSRSSGFLTLLWPPNLHPAPIMQDNEARVYPPITASLPPSLVLLTLSRRLHLFYKRLSSVLVHPVTGHFLSSGCPADLPDIEDSDSDSLPSLRKSLAHPPKRVIDLTLDDEGGMATTMTLPRQASSEAFKWLNTT
jgi:hypothetical protein